MTSAKGTYSISVSPANFATNYQISIKEIQSILRIQPPSSTSLPIFGIFIDSSSNYLQYYNKMVITASSTLLLSANQWNLFTFSYLSALDSVIKLNSLSEHVGPTNINELNSKVTVGPVTGLIDEFIVYSNLYSPNLSYTATPNFPTYSVTSYCTQAAVHFPFDNDFVCFFVYLFYFIDYFINLILLN